MQPQSVHPTRDGNLRVIAYYNANEVLVEFLETGYRRMARSGEIRRQRVKDHYKPNVFGVGYLGKGDFKANSRRVKSKAYVAWHNMLKRCYSEEFQKKYPYCKEVTVCDEWHNFQVFAKWFYDNYVEGYDLDKDKQIEGNKSYCPEACKFLPMSENRLTKGNTGKFWKDN